MGYDQEVTLDPEDVPLPAWLKAVLEENRVVLVQNVLPAGLYDYLRQWGTLSENEEERIKLNHITTEQMGLLLDLIEKKTLQDYENFKKALTKDKQGDITQLLTNAEHAYTSPSTPIGAFSTGNPALQGCTSSTIYISSKCVNKWQLIGPGIAAGVITLIVIIGVIIILNHKHKKTNPAQSNPAEIVDDSEPPQDQRDDPPTTRIRISSNPSQSMCDVRHKPQTVAINSSVDDQETTEEPGSPSTHIRIALDTEQAAQGSRGNPRRLFLRNGNEQYYETPSRHTVGRVPVKCPDFTRNLSSEPLLADAGVPVVDYQSVRDTGIVPLLETHQAVLDNHRADLVKYIVPSRVYDYLRQWNTLTEEEEERIKLNNTRADQVRQLLDIISHKPHQDYENFKQALIVTDQEFIADVLSADDFDPTQH